MNPMNKKRSGFFVCFMMLMGLVVSCTNSTEPSSEDTEKKVSLNDSIPVYDFSELEHLLYTDSDKTYIINFWAMWCAPCVEELPYIQQYADENPDVEVILVSLDFPEDIESKMKPFLKKKGITERVVILDDPNSNSWIDKIDPTWSGSLPFTIIFDKNERFFYERPFENIADLENEVKANFNK